MNYYVTLGIPPFLRTYKDLPDPLIEVYDILGKGDLRCQPQVWKTISSVYTG